MPGTVNLQIQQAAGLVGRGQVTAVRAASRAVGQRQFANGGTAEI